jgi:hypothetical protein
MGGACGRKGTSWSDRRARPGRGVPRGVRAARPMPGREGVGFEQRRCTGARSTRPGRADVSAPVIGICVSGTAVPPSSGNRARGTAGGWATARRRPHCVGVVAQRRAVLSGGLLTCLAVRRAPNATWGTGWGARGWRDRYRDPSPPSTLTYTEYTPAHTTRARRAHDARTECNAWSRGLMIRCSLVRFRPEGHPLHLDRLPFERHRLLPTDSLSKPQGRDPYRRQPRPSASSRRPRAAGGGRGENRLPASRRTTHWAPPPEPRPRVARAVAWAG